jgi:pimeloyl-ACP methyl ester carboxylesterase
MQTRKHFVSNNDGWVLALKQFYDPQTIKKGRRPIVIVPGYGMNSFIFGYHPTGLSMMEYIVSEGFEVWTPELRNQGDCINEGGSKNYNIGDIALVDLPIAFDFISENNISGSEKVDAIGCSLGGTFLYAYAVLVGTEKLGSLISMGGPLRWEDVHPLLKIAFGSPALMGAIPFAGTRKLAATVLPILVKYAPALLKIYMHPEIVDLSKSEVFMQSVEDPNRFLNREICEWMKSADLYINGVNITDGMAAVENPLLAMVANADGIVPERTVTSAIAASGAEVRDVVYCGNETIKMAHADMFISDYAQEMVFKPLCEWIAAQYPKAAPKKKRSTATKKKASAGQRKPAAKKTAKPKNKTVKVKK